MNLLLVEDDQMLGESICDGARQSGWHIDHVCDAMTARGALVDHAYAADALGSVYRIDFTDPVTFAPIAWSLRSLKFEIAFFERVSAGF